MKLLGDLYIIVDASSHPIRGGWIEINEMHVATSTVSRSHPTRGGWIEIL